MAIPANPKIYHIVHVDRLVSIIADGHLWCDAQLLARNATGTTIGMQGIKERRLRELNLSSYPDLHVGDCVPFYFCPRSVMLYLIYQANHRELTYRGGQGPILHLEADLQKCVDWAITEGRRWAFTLSNAGARYFEDRCDMANLNELNWQAIQSVDWRDHKEGKQAEFLIEHSFPWFLVDRIGVQSLALYQQVINALSSAQHQPKVDLKPDWYY